MKTQSMRRRDPSHPALLLALTSMLTLAVARTPPAAAQERMASPFDGLRPVTATLGPRHPSSHVTGPVPPSAPQHQPDVSGRVAGAIGLGAVASFALTVVGGIVGGSLDKSGDYSYGGILIGGAIGSVIGSTMGTSAVLGHPERALPGSLGGGLLGLVLVSGLANSGQDGLLLPVYSITQATVATLVIAAGGLGSPPRPVGGTR